MKSISLFMLLISSLLLVPEVSEAQTGGSSYRRSSSTSSSRSRSRSGGSSYRGYRSPTLQRSLTYTETRRRLKSIKYKVKSMNRQNLKPVVVFDIDDTIVYHGRNSETRTIYGAVNYVKTLNRAGANIVYLTARKESKRRETISMLRGFGLPLPSSDNLLMNPSRQNGADWKRSAKPKVMAHGKPVAFFDNDYAHVRNYREMYPLSRVFRLNTISRRRDRGGTGNIEVIRGFFY